LNAVKVSRRNVIAGVKVECSGKWKQTASGRKQKLSLTIGSIKTQSLSNVMSFGFSTIHTKHGVCSIKVWLSYRELNKF
jgi:ribosomal protein S3